MVHGASPLSRLLAVATLASSAWLPLALSGAPSAAAALPATPGCGFEVGTVFGLGALGTEYFQAPLIPDSPAESCMTTVTTTVTVVPNPSVPGAPTRYTDVSANPLTETDTVTFTPGRRPPTVSVGWDSFGCADPAVEGILSFFAVSGANTASIVVDPLSCALAPAPSSRLIAASVASDSAVGIASTPDGKGYVVIDQAGDVEAFGDASGTGAVSSQAPLVGIQDTPDGQGYWAAGAGGVFTEGDAGFYGSAATLALAAPVVGLAATPDGKGYWMVGSDGGVFAYGDARFYGSTGAIHLNAPIVGIARTPDGKGYWLVAADGGVFAFGDAAFDGSLGSVPLQAPVVGMEPDRIGGYWLVAADGGVFALGGAPFYGSAANLRLAAPISALAATPDGGGYWLLGADGGIFNSGDAGFYGVDLGL